MKLKSDSFFSQFIASNKRFALIGIAVIFGVLFILIGSNQSAGTQNTLTKAEQSIAELCSMTEGVGECRVHLTYRENDGEQTVYAVAIVCEGADSLIVREKLTSLVCSLYGIGANRVEILKIKK